MADENRIPEPAPVRRPARSRRAPKRGVRSKLLELVAESFPRLTRLLKVLRDWTRRKPLWVRVPLYGGLVLGVVVYFLGDTLARIPLVENVREDSIELVKDVFKIGIPEATGREFAIAVARIEDDDGTVGRLLGISLRISGVERLQIDRRLRFVDAANLDAAEARAQERARLWLEISQADLLIWGQTIPTDPPGVRLIMTPRNAPRGREAELAIRDQAFSFPEIAREPFEAAVQAQVLGFLAQFKPSHAVAEQLRHAITRLATVVRARPPGEGRAALVFALANARTVLGEQTGDDGVLAEAVATYRDLLAERPRAKVPLDWAMTQNNLGNALVTAGKRERGTEKLTQAVAAYRAALEEYHPDKLPAEWATTHNNLGYARESLARRGGGRARLEEAMTAYREALGRLSPATQDWAMVQNNLGNALVAMSEFEGGTETLTQAVAAFRAALQVRTREEVPLSWAMTQGNLGNAFAAWGERESAPKHLKAAIAAYREALKEYTVDQMPLEWARTQNNLGTALGRLGEREKSPAQLQQAIEAFRAALTQRPRDKLPRGWALTQRNLGNTLRSLGELENGTASLQQAVQALRAALGAISRDDAPIDWALAHHDLGYALRIMAERTGDPKLMGEAVGMFEAALSVAELKSTPHHRAMIQEKLWKATALHAELAQGAVSNR